MSSIPPYQPRPVQPMNPSDEKLWATLIHLSGIVLPVWGALIGYFVLKDRGPFVRLHVTEALNFQISLAIYSAAIIVLSIPTFGLAAFLVFPVAVIALIFMITAALAANRWQPYLYPLTIRFVKG